MVLGDGRRMDFWRELGSEEMPLMNAFPRIFSLSSKRNGPVEDFGSWQGQVWVWNIPLRRTCFDWEKDLWNAFISRLEQFKPRNLIKTRLLGLFVLKVFSLSAHFAEVWRNQA